MTDFKYKPFFGALKSIRKRDQFAQTPEDVYKILDEEFQFDYDPCPANPKFNGLEANWGQSNYVNPPYNSIPEWIKKAYDENQMGKQVVMLLPVRTHVKWFHEYGIHADEIRFIQGGIKFRGYAKKCPFPLMLLIFKA